MAQQIEVNLLIKAQTEQAKANIQQIGQLLNSIATNTTIGVNSGSLQQAVSAAQQLQIHLQNAVNADTGKINLDKLNTSLRTSGTSLNQLMTNLNAAGPQGQQAFIKIANAISAAEAPMLRLGGHLKTFASTLANTAKWQIASTLIHGIMSSVQGAVSYAKNLNTALNEIRIVSSQSASQMAAFADQASRAAKELNTTTTEYAKAALIFYQQGLEGSDVTDRANVVIKLANVTKQSAQTVSDQMTAIWNNFDNGTKSLEYYADAITKLGASTAASTVEISDGLEKFAAVSQTVGLSYEYATAAVATVIDKTRQSADVVGTAFKTIFARMEGLSLGETLEDGTDLNKYSEALAKVGVDIKNSRGEMKDMDDILDELGEKWKLLGKDAQVALAQSVGGLRQYNQFIALMNNWDDVKINVDIAMNAEGSLEEQQQTWSESWEAAAKRVEQAKNNLYKQFIDDESITKLTDIFAQLIESVGKAIDSMGGFGPMLLMIMGIFSKSFFPMLQTGFIKLSNSIHILTGAAARETHAMKEQINADITNMINSGQISSAIEQELTLSQQLSEAKMNLAKQTKYMNEAQKLEAQHHMNVYEALVLERQAALERLNTLTQEKNAIKDQLTSRQNTRTLATQAGTTKYLKDNENVSGDSQEFQNIYRKATSSTIAGTKRNIEAAEGRKITDEQIAAQQTKVNQLKTIADKKTGTEALAEFYKQEEILDKMKSSQKRINDEVKTEVEELQQVLNLQEAINEERKKGAENIAVGEVEYDFVPNELEGNDFQKNMINANIANLNNITGAETQESGVVASEATIANLEKLTQAQSEYNAQIQSYKALSQELQDAMSKETNLQNKLNQIKNKPNKNKKDMQEEKRLQEEVNKAKQEATKIYEQVSNKMKKMVESTDSSGNATKALEERLNSINVEGKSTEQKMQELSGVLVEMGQASAITRDGIDPLINDMALLLQEALGGQDGIQKYIEKLREEGNESAQLANKLELLFGAQEKVNNTPPPNTLITGLQTASALAGRLTMAISGVQMFVSAFEEGMTPLQTTMNLLMGISMTLPVIIGFIKMGTTANLISTAVTELKAGALTKETKSQLSATAAKIAETIATHNNTAATALNILVSAAQHPLKLAVAAATIAAAVAIAKHTFGTQKNTEAQLKQNAAQKESAEQSKKLAEQRKELIDKYEEESSGLDNLIGLYKQLEAAEQDVADTNEKIIESIDKLIDYYRQLNNTLEFSGTQQTKYQDTLYNLIDAKNLGDVEAQLKAQREMQKIATEIAIENAQNNAKAQANQIFSDSELEDKITKGSDVGNFRYAKNWNGGNNNYWAVDIQAGGQEDEDAYAKLKQGSSLNLWHTVSSGDMTLGFNTDNPEELKEQWNDLLEWIKAMEEANMQDTEVYRGVTQVRDSLKDNMEEFLKAQDEVEGLQDDLDIIQMQSDITDIDSLDEYYKYRDEIVKNRARRQGIEEETEDYKKLVDNVDKELGEMEFLSGIADSASKLESLARQTGQDLDELKIKYDEIISDPNQYKTFASIDFNKYQTEHAVKAEFQRLQGLADTEKIQIKITAYSDAIKALKDNMSTDDWRTIAESGINWGEEAIDFSAFMDMTLEEQRTYLNTELSKLTQEKADQIVEIQKQLVDSIANPLTEEERKNLVDELNKLKTEVAIETQRNQEQQLSESINSSNWNKLQQTIKETGMTTSEATKAYEKFLEAQAETLNLDDDEVKALAKQIPYLSNNFNILSETIKDNVAMQGQLAVHLKQTEKGLQSFADSQEDIEKGLNSSSLIEYSKAMVLLKESILDILGISDEFAYAGISLGETFETWAKNNYNIIIAALNDDKNAMNELWSQVMLDTYQQITGLSEYQAAQMVAGLASFRQETLNGTIQVGQELTEQYANFIEARMTYMLEVCHASEQEINAFLASIGVTADWALNQMGKLEVKTMQYSGIDLTSITGGLDKLTGQTTKDIDKQKRSEVVERYKEINDQLDDLTDAMDSASKAADRLYGANRIQEMQKVQALLKNEIELNEQKREEARANLELDRQELQNIATKANLSFEFDEAGNITNYAEAMNALYDYYETYYDSAQSGGFTEDEQQRLSEIEKVIKEVQDGIKTYDETRELIEDLDKEIQDKIYAWQDSNAEQLTYKLNLKLEITELDSRDLEYQISKLEGNVFAAGDLAEIMAKRADQPLAQTEAYLKAYQDLNEQYNTFDETTKARMISDADYKEQLETIKDGLYDVLSVSKELDDAMIEYYGNTLSLAQEEINKYTEQLEHNISILDHYASLLELLGKSKDYDTIGTVLKGQVSVAKNQAEAAKAQYEFYEQQRVHLKEQLDQALITGDTAAVEVYKQQYEAILEVTNTAQEEMLSATEEWLEKEKALIENELKKFAKDLENALTYGNNFNFLSNELQRASLLQDEYLTTTNKIYETNKLIATTQKEIDNTSNTVAKRKLQEFADETKQLQNRSKLSNYELQVQQAKYELLLAEIALEEARNSKSTVRLQRNAEGNYGYVYTADQNKVNDALMSYQEKENNLYNLGLENANSYTEKYYQTLQEGFEAVTQLELDYLNGEFETWEEYEKERDSLVAFYTEQLENYAYLQGQAIATHSDVAKDAWSTAFVTGEYSIVNTTKTWKKTTNKYIEESKKKLQEWDSLTEEISKKQNLDKLSKKVKAITTESKTLVDELTKKDGLLNTLENEFNVVGKVTDAWTAFRNKLVGNESVKAAISEIIGKLKTLQGNLDSIAQTNISFKTTYDENGQPVSIVGNGGTGVGGGSGDTNDIDENGFMNLSNTLRDHKAVYNKGDKVFAYDTNSSSFKSYTYKGESNGQTILADEEGKEYYTTKDYISSSANTGTWTNTGMDDKQANYHINDEVYYNGNKGKITNIEYYGGSSTPYYTWEGTDSQGRPRTEYNILEENLSANPSLTGKILDDNSLTDEEKIKDWYNKNPQYKDRHNKINQFARFQSSDLRNDNSNHNIEIVKILDEKWSTYHEAPALLIESVSNAWPKKQKYVPVNSKYFKTVEGYMPPAYAIGQHIRMQNSKTYIWDISGYSKKNTDKRVDNAYGVITDHQELGGSNLYQISGWDNNQPNGYWVHGSEIADPNHFLYQFDTGGYTGEWGPDGKLALLHQKELVLNQDDTSNFLSALGLLDNILLTLDKYSINAQLGGLLSSPAFAMNAQDNLEQNVHIEASFPGVQDRNEIEEAFNNLINKASQFANRKS